MYKNSKTHWNVPFSLQFGQQFQLLLLYLWDHQIMAVNGNVASCLVSCLSPPLALPLVWHWALREMNWLADPLCIHGHCYRAILLHTTEQQEAGKYTSQTHRQQTCGCSYLIDCTLYFLLQTSALTEKLICRLVDVNSTIWLPRGGVDKSCSFPSLCFCTCDSLNARLMIVLALVHYVSYVS